MASTLRARASNHLLVILWLHIISIIIQITIEKGCIDVSKTLVSFDVRRALFVGRWSLGASRRTVAEKSARERLKWAPQSRRGG